MSLKLYLRIVGATGIALLGGLALDGGWSPSRMTIVHWVLIAFLVLGELMPIRLAGHDDEVNTSSAFSFALMASLGLAPAALAQATASVLADLRLRKSLDSTLFNVGQYTISLAAAGVTMHTLSDLPREMSGAPVTAYELAVLALCGLVFFAINNTLAGTAYALLERNSIISHLREDL